MRRTTYGKQISARKSGPTPKQPIKHVRVDTESCPRPTPPPVSTHHAAQCGWPIHRPFHASTHAYRWLFSYIPSQSNLKVVPSFGPTAKRPSALAAITFPRVSKPPNQTSQGRRSSLIKGESKEVKAVFRSTSCRANKPRDVYVCPCALCINNN